MPIGTDAGSRIRHLTVFELKWTNEPIKILGIWIHSDREIMIERIYFPLLQKMRDMITMGKHRSQTPCGRIQVISVLMTSIITFRLMALSTHPRSIL